MDAQPTLTTERLTLRPFSEADIAVVAKLANDRDIADNTINIPHPYNEAIAGEWISTHRDAYAKRTGAVFAAVITESGEFIGSIALTFALEFDNAELGYWIGKPFWGNGYCTEAAREIVRWGFQEIGLHKIYASYFPRNPASGKVMEKIGMKKEGCLREHRKVRGNHESLVYYGILEREFRGQE